MKPSGYWRSSLKIEPNGLPGCVSIHGLIRCFPVPDLRVLARIDAGP